MNTHTKVNRRTVMAEANALKGNSQLTRSECVKQGYKIARLYAAFAAGAISVIAYMKADGSYRTAHALPPRTGEALVKGTGKSAPKSNVLYWDMDKGEFRSFVKARLLSVAVK